VVYILNLNGQTCSGRLHSRFNYLLNTEWYCFHGHRKGVRWLQFYVEFYGAVPLDDAIMRNYNSFEHPYNVF
jgi:hypothetical protein